MVGVSSVFGNDGKLLGVTCRDGTFVKREHYDTWDEFLGEVARVVVTRIPRDTETEISKQMIWKDEERLLGLRGCDE